MPTRITGVAAFGFFATVVGVGGDGLVPISTLGSEYFVFDKGTQMIEGTETGKTFTPGMRLDLKLVEANPVTGGLRFELPDAEATPLREPRQRRDRQRPGPRSGQRQPRAHRRQR